MDALPLAAFLLTALLHLAALRLYPRLGLLDFPERYGLTRARLPYPTGAIAVIVFLAYSPLLLTPGLQMTGIVAGITLLAAVCIMDDRRPLPFSVRLSVQALVAALIFLSGTRIFSLTNPLDAWMDASVIPLDTFAVPSALFSNPSLVGLAFTVLWLMVTMNALNWLDGIPGQASTLSAIGFLVIGLLSFSDRVGQPELGVIAMTLAAIAGASALFDCGPRVIPGDTGAMFYGLMLGTLTIYAGGKLATAFLVLGVPLIDFGLVIARRMLRKRNPFRGSKGGEHLHHRLLEAGAKPRHIIALTAVIGTGFGAAALFLSTFEKFLAALCMGALLLCVSLWTDALLARRKSSATR